MIEVTRTFVFTVDPYEWVQTNREMDNPDFDPWDDFATYVDNYAEPMLKQSLGTLVDAGGSIKVTADE